MKALVNALKKLKSEKVKAPKKIAKQIKITEVHGCCGVHGCGGKLESEKKNEK